MRLDRLQATLMLLSQCLKASEDAFMFRSLADLCTDEAGDIYARALLAVVQGLEANCETQTAPADGSSSA